MSTNIMSAQIEAAEEYRTLLRNPKIIIRNIVQLISQLSKFVPGLLFKKYEDFGWKRDGLEETEIEELMGVELFLTEQIYCFQNNLTSRFELDLFAKQGGTIKIPCRIN